MTKARKLNGKRSLTVFFWATYDFANTIFSMNVVTLYFALWVTIDMHGEDILYGVYLAASMLCAACVGPILGALADRIKRKKPFLIAFTLLCCFATAAITFAHSLLLGLILFAIANFSFQIADVFYNSLLPDVSGEQNIGRVSGYGTALGYVGTIVGLLLVLPFALYFGRQATFLPTAFFFLLFALPCFLFVREIHAQTTGWKKWAKSKLFRTAFCKTRETVINIRRYPHLWRFLLAAFIALNAINTVYIFMSVYAKKVIGLTDKEVVILYVVSSLFAIVGSLLAGSLADKVGAQRTFKYVLMLWCVGAALAATAFNKEILFVIGPLIGICLGGTWTSARVLTVALAPRDMIAEVFGFYGLVGKTATILGPLIWGGIVWGFGFLGPAKYRVAVATLMLLLVASIFVVNKVPNKVVVKG